MKKLLCSCSSIVVLACASAALAGGPQVMPVVETGYFDGLSVGVNLSYHHTSFETDANANYDIDISTQSGSTVSTEKLNLSIANDDASADDENGYAGGQITYGHSFNNRWYLGATVFGEGGEAEATTTTQSSLPIGNDFSQGGNQVIGTLSTKAEVENGVGAAIKVGALLSDRVLAYLKGGAELSRIEVDSTLDVSSTGVAQSSQSIVVDPTHATASDAENKTGWLVGAGLAYALNQSLSIYGEYTFTDYGTVDADNGSSTPITANVPVVDDEGNKDIKNERIGTAQITDSDVETKVSTFAVGLNWKLPFFV